MYIAVDTGGTKTLVVAFNADGKIIEQIKFETPKVYNHFISNLSETIKGVAGEKGISVISLAIPGHVEDDNGIVEGLGNLSWKHKDIVKDLSAEFGPKVIMDNDANLGALGEATFGAGKGKRKVLYITVSTGIGTGITVDGVIDPALKESEGGQIIINHQGKPVRWEEFGSGKAFFKHYGKPGKEVDDPKIWKEFAQDLATGIWDLNTLVQPDIIVIGGSMGVHFYKYKEFLETAFHKFKASVVDHPKIVQAKFPDEAVINGCYQAARQYEKSA